MSDAPIAGRASDWLSLAAAPTFALAALLTGMSGQQDMLCSPGHSSPMSGMTAMYLLMAAFHFPPWLKRLSR
jgi:hypothetical protein